MDGGPDTLLYSPSCRPWSIASTKRDLQQTQQERASEMPTINFIRKKFKERSKRKKGNIVEQPWTSALWEELHDLPGERYRTDQCRYKAQDEQQNPILKPTGFHADIFLKHSIARCNGHQGRRHGWLQGVYQGNNRTTLAAVYPEGLCRALIRDIKNYINHKSKITESYYKCERCAMGELQQPIWNTTFCQVNADMENGLREKIHERRDAWRKRSEKRRTSSRPFVEKP